MDEATGEDEEPALADCAGIEVAAGGDEGDVKGALKDVDDLGGARVGVRWVYAPRSVIDPGRGDTQGVEPRSPSSRQSRPGCRCCPGGTARRRRSRLPSRSLASCKGSRLDAVLHGNILSSCEMYIYSKCLH
jgi:hypothetical protein